MNSVARALAFAFANVLHPRMLWLMVWPVMVAILVWGSVAIVYWTQLVLRLAGIVEPWMQSATFFLAWDAGDAALFAAKLLILLMLVPIIQLTALAILALFGMPAMVEHVAIRRYPQLARLRGGSFAGSVLNSLLALAGLVVLAVASIPFWIFPPLWPLIPLAILGWVNQRLLRYDALAEHARACEMRAIFAAERGALYLMGFLLALVAYVPVLGLFAPVLFGLAFIHYLLAALQALRAVPIEVSATTVP